MSQTMAGDPPHWGPCWPGCGCVGIYFAPPPAFGVVNLQKASSEYQRLIAPKTKVQRKKRRWRQCAICGVFTVPKSLRFYNGSWRVLCVYHRENLHRKQRFPK